MRATANGHRVGDVGDNESTSVDEPDSAWRTCIGFGTSDSEAIDNAIATVEDGYETERNRY